MLPGGGAFLDHRRDPSSERRADGDTGPAGWTRRRDGEAYPPVTSASGPPGAGRPAAAAYRCRLSPAPPVTAHYRAAPVPGAAAAGFGQPGRSNTPGPHKRPRDWSVRRAGRDRLVGARTASFLRAGADGAKTVLPNRGLPIRPLGEGDRRAGSQRRSVAMRLALTFPVLHVAPVPRHSRYAPGMAASLPEPSRSGARQPRTQHRSTRSWPRAAQPKAALHA